MNTLMECHPVSSRLITIHLRAVPFNITEVKAYSPTSDFDDSEVEDFSDQLQNAIDQTPGKDILVVQGDWNTKVGKDACENWQGIYGHFCNDNANERGLRLQDFATFNDLVLSITLVITKHPEDGPTSAQLDNTTTSLITFS